MKPLNLEEVRDYVNEHIVDFHQRRINSLETLTLEKLLNKNPYLFRAKNITTAGELVIGLLEAFLSSSEEKLFGDFLEGLAVFVSGKTCDGHKSAAPGVDLEFINRGIHYSDTNPENITWHSNCKRAGSSIASPGLLWSNSVMPTGTSTGWH